MITQKQIDKIKVGHYVKQLIGGFDALSTDRVVPPIRCHKIISIHNECYKEKTCPYQYKTLTLEYIGNNIRLPESAQVYFMCDLMPFCQFDVIEINTDERAQ